VEPDELDWKIIDLLREEAVPNSAVAEALGVSEGTIRTRLKRLKESGVLEIRALINPDVLANKQLVLVGMTVAEARLLEAKAREVAALPGVQSVSIASGRYDLIAEVMTDSNRGLVSFLTGPLAGVEGIRSSESFLMLQSYGKFV
jgi:Lrp/AsnC family transcriptional regulator for asnA, asnC and gidA